MSISTDHKIIAKAAHHAFGGKPGVSRYWDENSVSNIGMLTTVNRPFDGVSSYSTIGLSDHSIGLTVDETPLRIEIVGASATDYEQFPNILASCAFGLINSKLSVSHGGVFRNIIQMYYPNIEMRHVLFVSPFLWEDLKTLEFPNKKVAWLLAVPISENEYLFAQEKGTDSLEELFEQEEIDIFDLERGSIV